MTIREVGVMRYGYIRVSGAGPSEKQQQSTLAGAAVAEFVVDDVREAKRSKRLALVERTRLLAKLAKGDQVVVTSAARIGTSPGDILEFMQQIHARGATICDLETGETITWHPDAAVAIDFVRRAELGQRNEIARKMNRRRAERGNEEGPPPKLTVKGLEKARELWADPELTVAEIAKRVGVVSRTLYRRLGPRERIIGEHNRGAEKDA
jgi:DNA invertase Pin-like site-specific DNA recombinase